VRDGMKSGMILKSKLKSVTTSRVAPERGKWAASKQQVSSK
jgi:hypothetical protein